MTEKPRAGRTRGAIRGRRRVARASGKQRDRAGTDGSSPGTSRNGDGTADRGDARARRRRDATATADAGAPRPPTATATETGGRGRRRRRTAPASGDRPKAGRGRGRRPPADGGVRRAQPRRRASWRRSAAELDERTGDLQRVTAEYANYRKRVDRDRALVAGAGDRLGADRAAADPGRPGPGAGARRPGRAVRLGGRAAHRGAWQVRADAVRGEGRPVRPDPARGGRAPDLRRRHRADLRRGACAAATCSASGCCGRRWSPSPTRNDVIRPTAWRRRGRTRRWTR